MVKVEESQVAEAPTSLAGLADAVRAIAAEGRGIFPVGGGRRLDFGCPPSREGVRLPTDRLTRIDDYPADDMTITVESGIRIAELARVLAEKGQELPIDLADAEVGTLGGAIACNASGPRRFGHGTLRDFLLGIDVIGADGARIHGGGRVVKNVAGYDFMKLHTGALGTLGVLAQVTLKLKPLPGRRAVVWVDLPKDRVELALELMTRTKTRPVAIELLNRPAMRPLESVLSPGETPWSLVLLLEETSAAVIWQADRLREEFAELDLHTAVTDDTERYAAVLSQLTRGPAGPVVFKASVVPSGVFPLCREAFELFADVTLQCHAGSGIVRGAFAAASLAEVEGRLETLTNYAVACSGGLVIDRRPADWTLPLWRPTRADWAWMGRLKRKLDPDNLFNPGRFTPCESA